MNTASRMESNSIKGRIHMSQVRFAPVAFLAFVSNSRSVSAMPRRALWVTGVMVLRRRVFGAGNWHRGHETDIEDMARGQSAARCVRQQDRSLVIASRGSASRRG